MILNCLIREEWILKAAKRALENRAEYDKGLPKEVNISPDSKAVPGKRDEQGRWLKFPSENSYSSLASGGKIWIRPDRWSRAANGSKEMLALARKLGIDCSAAKIRILQDGAGFRTKSAGVVLRLRDACQFLIAWKPGIVEERRERIYNNDDH